MTLNRVFRALECIIALALAAMVALVFANVVLRYAFESGMPFAEELSRYLFVWVIFLGAIVAMRERLHIGVTGLVAALPPPAQSAVAILSGLLVIVCCAVLADGSIRQTAMNWGTASQVAGIPMFLVYGMPAIAGLAMGVLAACEVWRGICSLLHREDDGEPRGFSASENDPSSRT